MDKVEGIVGRLRDKSAHSAEAYGVEEYMSMGKFWNTYADLSSEAADLIQSQQALIEEMRAALEFYTGIHEPALSRPSEGPWGVNSTDFGERARNVLEALSQKE